MRQWMILLAMLLVVGTAQAQDKSAPMPIIALHENKLYAVSPVDGADRVLVEPPAGQTFFMRGFASVSPDGIHMVYATQTDPESPTGYIVTVFVLDVTTGKTEVLQPGGGVFDRPARQNYHFRLDYPTWSVDGARLYYVRSQVDDAGRGKATEAQLGYYDVASQTHKLVARLDPKRYVQGLMAVEEGIIAHFFSGLGADQPVTLYAADNRLVSENTIVNLYPYPVRYKNQGYYATGEAYGGIANIMNVHTGDRQFLGDGYYAAARSRLAGDQSLLVIRTIGTVNWYRVFGSDQQRLPKIIEDTYGVQYAIAPDGQSVAYLQYDSTQRVPIRILEADGSERELPFIAEEIYWSAAEYVVFYEEARG